MADLLTSNILTLDQNINNCRLTLETGVAVSTSDQTAKTAVFLTPYSGNRLALFNGTNWQLYAITADKSLALGTLTSGKLYDIFAADSSGNVTMEFSAAWASDTARTDALTTQDGVLVKSGSVTKRYLGTIRTTSTTTTEDSLTKRFVWNSYNQVDRPMSTGFVSDSHSYTTATWREWHAGTNSTRLQFVVGDTALVAFAVSAQVTCGGTSANIAQGLDITNNASGLAFGYPLNNSMRGGPPTSSSVVTRGYHFLAVVQYGETGDTFLDYNQIAKLLN